MSTVGSPNPVTDELRLVETTTVHGFLNIFRQTVSAEDGFSLELFRGGTHLGSITASQMQQTGQMQQRIQAMGAKGGDTIYRINLGPKTRIIQHQLNTQDRYVRGYSVAIELQVIDSHEFIKLYRQGADPVNLAVLSIREALQEYGDRTYYEKMSPASIQAQAKYAFDKEPKSLRAGIGIIRTYQPALGEDKNYKPTNRSPLLAMSGQLTTLEGYIRNYEVTVELLINNLQEYKYLEYTGADPLNLAKLAIEGELQRFARQEFYETLAERQLREIIEHAFDRLPQQMNSGLQIIRTHHFSLGQDKNYQPVNRSPLLKVDGTLTTGEGYARPYVVTVELQVIDLRLYLQLDREGAVPLNLAKAAIDGELQRYTCDKDYETLSELQLHQVVGHAFDTLSGRVTGGLKVVRAHRFTLGADTNYKPINRSPSLEVGGKLITSEGYARPYAVTVELQVTDARLYLQLDREGADPLNLAKAAIDGELQRYTCDKGYETLSELQLHQVVEHAFDTLPSRIKGGLEIVRAHRFTLGNDPDYINLGHRVLTITGTIDTADLLKRDYEMTLELEIDLPQEFVRLTREGNDPLKLVREVIEGAIARAVKGQKHDELSDLDLHQVAQEAFTNAPDATIGGLRVVKAHKAILRVDVRKQETADIITQAEVEKVKKSREAELDDLQNQLDFDSAQKVADQEITLARKQQQKDKEEYLFNLDRDRIEEHHRLSKALSQWAYSQFVDHASEALQANEPIQKIVQDMGALSLALQTGLPQIAESPTSKQLPEGRVEANMVSQEQRLLNPGQSSQNGSMIDGQFVEVDTLPKPNKIENAEVGLTLTEVAVHPSLFSLLDGHNVAFQVRKVLKGSPAQNAGFQRGDYIMDIDGEDAYTSEAIKAGFSSFSANGMIEVFVLQNGIPRNLVLRAAKAEIDED
jgi:hypothetical protein